MPSEASLSTNVAPETNTSDLITRAELLERLAAPAAGGGSLRLLEALPRPYFEQGHLPGAINFPHDRTRELAPRLLPDRDSEIVVYCASPTCRNSHVAAGVLRTLGYRNVRVYGGGKQDWQEAGLPLEV